MKGNIRGRISLFFLVAIISIIAACGGGGGADSVDDAANSAPVANAGTDLTVKTGSTVVLDGSGCFDADGDRLIFTWSLQSAPDGSLAALSDNSVVSPSFTADVDGTYLVNLVVSDGKADSHIDSTTVTAFTEATPDISVTPLDHDFGEVEAGRSSAPLTVTVYNDGSAALSISDISLVTGSAFSLSLNGGSNPCAIGSPVLAEGESCTMEVTFNPDSEGTYEDALRASSDDPDEQLLSIALTGAGVDVLEPDISVTPLNHEFGNIVAGSSSAPLLVTVSNAGSDELNVSDISLVTGSAFSLSLNGGSSPCAIGSPVLAPGESCTLEVTFAPVSTGMFSDSINIISNDQDESVLGIALSGTGVVATEPDISVSPLDHDFGEVEVTRSSNPLVVYIRNEGNISLNITEISLAIGRDFSYSLLGGGNSCVIVPRPLYQKRLCTMTVTFAPTAAGALSDSLIIRSDDPDEPVISVSLTGTGLPEYIPPTSTETAKLKASDAAANEYFGGEVALSGTTAFVGAPFSNTYGTQAGAVYVFEGVGNGMWKQMSRLVPSDAAEYYRFGSSISVDGTTAAVGSEGRGVCGEGAVYVFNRNLFTGVWEEGAVFTSSEVMKADAFGASVSLQGTRMAIGAPGQDSRGNAAGAAYVFELNRSGIWEQVAKLMASDGSSNEEFGMSVSLSGDRILVGTPMESRGSLLYYPGAAYVFERDPISGTWHEVAKLTASDAEDYDYFGTSVSLSGTRAVVGAWGEGAKGYYAGAAYVFERDSVSGAWKEVAKLTASDAREWDMFGKSVAMSADRIVVGAGEPHPDGIYPGSAYVFERDSSSGAWQERVKLIASDSWPGDSLGASVTLNGSTMLLGAPNEDSRASNSGAAYIFELEPLNYK